jgi:hypothetical protein
LLKKTERLANFIWSWLESSFIQGYFFQCVSRTAGNMMIGHRYPIVCEGFIISIFQNNVLWCGPTRKFSIQKTPTKCYENSFISNFPFKCKYNYFQFFTGIKLHMYMKIWQWIIDMQSDWGGIINPSQTIGYLCPIIMLPAVLETHWKKYPWIKEDSNQLQSCEKLKIVVLAFEWEIWYEAVFITFCGCFLDRKFPSWPTP